MVQLGISASTVSAASVEGCLRLCASSSVQARGGSSLSLLDKLRASRTETLSIYHRRCLETPACHLVAGEGPSPLTAWGWGRGLWDKERRKEGESLGLH